MENTKQLHRILEGAIFASAEPLSIDQLASLFDESQRPDKKEMKEALEELAVQYEERGIELKQLASGYQFQVKADLSPWIKKLWEERPPRYSRALMETLALVAYRQPITRAEIEEVRGVVVSTNIMRTLMEHGWIRIVGHRDVPGKPGLYATTKQFLDNFGLKSLSELPSLSEIQDLHQMERGLEEALVEANSDSREELIDGSEDDLDSFIVTDDVQHEEQQEAIASPDESSETFDLDEEKQEVLQSDDVEDFIVTDGEMEFDDDSFEDDAFDDDES